jgi:hypothetical protein
LNYRQVIFMPGWKWNNLNGKKNVGTPNSGVSAEKF